MEIIYTQNYQINTTHVNSTKKLGLIGILGFLQDAASEHAEILGFGYDNMINKNIFWVLFRQKLIMAKWPKWHDIITIRTWPKHFQGLYAFREFEILLDHKKIGECSTTWMILDGTTRKPMKSDFLNECINTTTDYTLDFVAEKINVSWEFPWSKSYEVRNSDIDLNNHVNNTKYAQWILDTIPFEYHKTHVVKEFEINFTSETMLGDTINVQHAIHDNRAELIFKGIRDSDEKMVFAARILAEKI
ncbi:MAG: acyl-[acyl-carrier-protein] thioesterase [Candidatus Marinimicrobia bacterium]|nr:acyl-[acyl-carrier-protein] thioesterase [Candidatus Neomarinimicrobiota bacterium]